MKYKSNTIKFNVFFIIGITLLFCAFFAKFAYISLSPVVEGTNLKELDKSRTITKKTLIANRGNILDYNGEYLAQNVNSYTVIAILSPTRTVDKKYPKHVVDKEKTATVLSEILEPLNSVMTKEYILKLLNTKGYQVELGPGGRGISELTKRKIEEASLPGIEFISSVKRYYSKGDFASYIIGFVTKDEETGEMVGRLGIEEFVETKGIKGKNGSITYQKDAYGYQIANTESYTVPAEDGYDFYLTIDSQVQMFIDNAIQEFEKKEPEWVTITIANAKTGAIVGSSSYPSFDPNTKEGIKSYLNPLVSYPYEPGSTMKIFSFASAIEEGVYKGSESYKSGTINVADYKIKDWNKVGWGTITYDTGFTYSSNVAAVKLGQAIAKKSGKKSIINYYNNLGFGSKTGVQVANESIGSKIEPTQETEFASITYGQGLMVTPIQMVKALTSITNDGTVLKPFIVDKVVDTNKNEVVYQSKRTEVKKVYSTSTVNKIMDLMDKTVNGEDPVATGKGYHSDNVRLIGKTGTANYAKNGKYITGTYTNIRSFAGVFPRENPEYIIYVAVKDFKGSSKQMGGIVKNMVESISTYKNINERDSDKNDLKNVTISNFLNKSVDSSIDVLKKKKINYIVVGNGKKVIKQYPAKDAVVSIGTKVYLLTNGSENKMPDILGWSEKEVKDFCNITKINCDFSGYGYVKSTNIKENDIINQETQLKVELEKIEPIALHEEEMDDEEKEE